MGLRVGDDEISRAERPTVDAAKDSSRQRACAEAAAIADQRVGQRDEGIEDDRASSRGPSRCGEIEMSGVSDQDDVRARQAPGEQAHLGEQQTGGRAWAERPFLFPPFPDRLVALDHVDAGAPKARDHLGVAGVSALVGAEVEDAHLVRDGLVPAGLQDLVDVELVRRAGALLVVARDELAEQAE